MRKDDYFVIAYRILAVLYEKLKAGESVDLREISHETMGINERYWAWIMRAMRDSGRMTGVEDVAGGVVVDEPEITETGILFLMENSGIEKAKRFLKELKAAVPGL